ncbi:hypothetical protein acsn021_28130 [Anaerocolumna cellulosilytica]|uniref:Uncharacterized protein n=1 Tax=Anaerocolumna cellulosilytica TaxID=433286 RepID=A0A6S6QX84_9FIRM|nr:flagellar hook-length control protein FliK [Anaerocolumna cellulosilytica]MBB5197030.1 flagellar hook-length control protein FliK [Anaerocolumna cellulosilytica]BCJ95244.1 hypothetical protein acsn021_28130 [Anaerocolumna cellulosilytica]
MTANLKTQLFDLAGSGQNNKVSMNQKSSGNDFAGIMDNSVKSKDVLRETVAATKKTFINKSQVPAKSDFNKIQQEVNKNTVLSSTGTEGLVLAGEIDPLADGKMDNIAFSNIEDFIAALQNSIQEQLGISKEELEKAMETLGLTMLDLLNPDNLKQLVLQVKGAEDISEFLTNEELADTLKQLSETVKSVTDDFGVTKEQVEQYLDSINNQEKQDEYIIAPTTLENPDEESSAKELNATKDSSETAATSGNGTSVEVYKTDSQGQNTASDNTGNKEEAAAETSLESFIQNLAVKGSEGLAGFEEEVSNSRQIQDITTQIIEQIKVFIKPEQTSMEIQLNPEHLGKVNLSVVAKDGILTAQFQTQNEIAKEAIESQLHILRENLNQQGLKVEAIEVTVANFNFTGSDQAAGDTQKHQEKSGNRGRLFEGSEAIEEEKIENSSLDSLEQATNSVDYTV